MELSKERDNLAIRKQTAEEYKDPLKRKKFYEEEIQKVKIQMISAKQDEKTTDS